MAGFKECMRGALLSAALVTSGLLALEQEANATPFSTTSIAVAQSDWFSGWSVATSGARVLVGSRDSERARLFEKSGASYALSSTFAPTVSAGSRFGSAVALAGERAIIGASADTNAAGLPTGAVYIYQRVAGLWTL